MKYLTVAKYFHKKDYNDMPITHVHYIFVYAEFDLWELKIVANMKRSFYGKTLKTSLIKSTCNTICWSR